MVEREEKMLAQIELVEKNKDALKTSQIKELQESKPSEKFNQG